MPNRWLKEAYITSPRIHAASLEARDLWIRLILRADDYGRYTADPALVAGSCLPRDPDLDRIERGLTELEMVGLIVRYEAQGKQYLAIAQWYERPRSKSKFPEPPEKATEHLHAIANNCKQLPAIACSHAARARLTATTTTTTTTISTLPKPAQQAGDKPDILNLEISTPDDALTEPPGFRKFWASYPADRAGKRRKVQRSKCLGMWIRGKFERATDRIIEHVAASVKFDPDWQQGFHPATVTYLSQQRWNDGLPLAPEMTTKKVQL